MNDLQLRAELDVLADALTGAHTALVEAALRVADGQGTLAEVEAALGLIRELRARHDAATYLLPRTRKTAP